MDNLTFSIGATLQHHGICDASSSVAIDEHRFIVALSAYLQSDRN